VSRTPIADYALLSDCRSAALVSRAGSIDWLCLPRFDSPSVFGRILDQDAGHWTIHPTTEGEVSRRYRERTMVLETTFRTASGQATLVDAMAAGPNPSGHDLCASSPRVLLRQITCDEGRVELEMEYAPRTEYGIVWPVLGRAERGLTGRGGADLLALSSPLAVEISDARAKVRFTVRAGERVAFALQHRSTWEEHPRFFDQKEVFGLVEETTSAWQSWSQSHQNYQGPWRDLVYQSGTVLQALTFKPTGAIVAAPTSSLPEAIGGVRNWDYRYTWIRDAAFSVYAFRRIGMVQEAYRFVRWVLDAIPARKIGFVATGKGSGDVYHAYSGQPGSVPRAREPVG
jgi:alpha,alpha-trehalase